MNHVNPPIKIAFFLSVAILLSTGAAQALPSDNITVFGDSLSDAKNLKYPNRCGNNKWVKSPGAECVPEVTLLQLVLTMCGVVFLLQIYSIIRN